MRITTTQLKQTAFYLASVGLFLMIAVPVIREYGIIGILVILFSYYSICVIGQKGRT